GRPGARPRAAGRGPRAGLQRHGRLLRRPRGDGGRDRRRGLAAHRRRRRLRRAGQPEDHRPHQGHVHRRRVQRLPSRDRERPHGAPGRRAGRGHRRARPPPGRGGQGLRRAPRRGHRRRGRAHRLGPGANGQLQGAALGRGRRRAAAQRHRQGAQVRAAGAGAGPDVTPAGRARHDARMADLLSLSARIIDSGVADEPTNRVTQELSEVADGVAVVESFSHAVAVRTDDGLVVFDASGAHTGAQVVEALRGWSDAPVHTLVYTHGHVDHVGGSGAFVAHPAARGHARPRVVAHAAVARRFARYRRTDGWNLIINARQFGGIRDRSLRIGGEGPSRFLPDDVAAPDLTYTDRLALTVGGLDVELRHGRGETDDHTWAWIPSLRAVACGDFLIWNFPNAGNPQKVQRYPDE